MLLGLSSPWGGGKGKNLFHPKVQRSSGERRGDMVLASPEKELPFFTLGGEGGRRIENRCRWCGCGILSSRFIKFKGPYLKSLFLFIGNLSPELDHKNIRT